MVRPSARAGSGGDDELRGRDPRRPVRHFADSRQPGASQEDRRPRARPVRRRAERLYRRGRVLRPRVLHVRKRAGKAAAGAVYHDPRGHGGQKPEGTRADSDAGARVPLHVRHRRQASHRPSDRRTHRLYYKGSHRPRRGSRHRHQGGQPQRRALFPFEQQGRNRARVSGGHGGVRRLPLVQRASGVQARKRGFRRRKRDHGTAEGGGGPVRPRARHVPRALRHRGTPRRRNAAHDGREGARADHPQPWNRRRL